MNSDLPQVCRICGVTPNVEFIDFGQQPNGNHLVVNLQPTQIALYETSFSVCTSCASVQQMCPPSAHFMFEDHPYLTGTSKVYISQLRQFVDYLFENKYVAKKGLVVDIGCNDGTLLEIFRDFGCEVMGVDPSSTSKQYSQAKDLFVDQDFWNLQKGIEYSKRGISPDIFVSTASFYHMPDVLDWMNGIKECLSQNGFIAVQFVSLMRVIENVSIDQLYHEHTYVHSLNAVDRLCKRLGFKIVDAKEVEVQGGSIIAVMARDSNPMSPSKSVSEILEKEEKFGLFNLNTYLKFSSSFEFLKENIKEFFEAEIAAGRIVAALGASLRGISLLNYCGLTNREIAYATEVNPEKIGKWIPKASIPIIDENEMTEMPDSLFVLSWTFKNLFIDKYSGRLKNGQKLVFPFPTFEVIEYK